MGCHFLLQVSGTPKHTYTQKLSTFCSLLLKKKIGLPGGIVGKNPPASAGDMGSIPGPGRFDPGPGRAAKPEHHNY